MMRQLGDLLDPDALGGVQRLDLVGRHVDDQVGLAGLQRRDAEPSSGIGLHVARRTAGFPLPVLVVRLDHDPVVLHPLDELEGPVPTGLRLAWTSPTCATYFGAIWYMRVMRAGIDGSGTLVWNRTV